MKKTVCFLLIFMIFTSFTACGELLLTKTQPNNSVTVSEIASSINTDLIEKNASPSEEEQIASESLESEESKRYINQFADEVVWEIISPTMSEYEKAKSIFDFMIINTSLAEPVGLDLWRIRENVTQPPTYVENRSLSVLLYGMGMCEDYAAAFTMLLRAAGLEAEYVPGLTYSAEGYLVDHAWVVAKVDGIWYHLDPQLEDNVSRHGAVLYRYFMRGDATMSGSHRWGENLINSKLLSQEQNQEIAQNFTPPTCPQNYQTPTRLPFVSAPEPNRTVIEEEIAAEFQLYEEANGPLEDIKLNIVPPVFGVEGYGPEE